MRKPFRIVFGTLGAVAVTGVLGLSQLAMAEEEKKEMSAAEEGKEIAFDRAKGNCLACHMIEGGEMTGTIGPPLIAMKTRFTDEALKAQITDPRTKNPNTIMPPFGANSILSEAEIDKVVEFIHGL